MKNTAKLLNLAFIALLFQACQKDNPDIDPQVVTHDSITVLSTLVDFNVTVSATDTALKTDYIYDDLHRVTLINGYEFTNGIPSLLNDITYYYTGTDTLAYRSVSRESGTPYMTDTYYFYDDMQRLIRDSSIITNISGGGTSVTTYTYSGSMITAQGDSFSDTGYVGNTGNVITTNSFAGTEKTFTTDLTYDNHLNAFYQLNIHTTYYPIPDPFFDIEGDYVTKNNVVSVSVQNFLYPAGNFQYSYSYTYNSSGLPATADVSYSAGAVDDHMVYVYKKMQRD